MNRWLKTLGLALLVMGSACGDDQPAAKAPSAKDLLKRAVQAANKDDLAQALKLAEQALQGAPDDREGMYLLGVLAMTRADELKVKGDKIAMLRKSAAALDRLRARYPDLTPTEAAFAAASRLGEARALALEGKADGALAAIKDALAGGFDNIDAIEREDDLAAVRGLPGFRDALAQGIKAGVVAAIKGTKPFPFDFELKDLDDKAVNLADYKGKVTIVDIWGTWCPPCRMEIPHFVDLYQQYKGKGLEIVGINCNEEGTPAEVKKTIKDFAKEQKVEYKCLLNDDKTEAKVPGFQGYPTTLFLDRAGKVRLMLVGYTPKVKLDAIVATLLAEEGGR